MDKNVFAKKEKVSGQFFQDGKLVVKYFGVELLLQAPKTPGGGWLRLRHELDYEKNGR